MKPQIDTMLADLKNNRIAFKDVLTLIDDNYQHQPTAFKNGDVSNAADQNQGSARVFYFAQLNELDQDDTLQLFAEHYQAVLSDPDGTDHQNIRQFMQNGWAGVIFEGEALVAK